MPRQFFIRSILPAVVTAVAISLSSCSDGHSPVQPGFQGTWKVRFTPAVNLSDPLSDSHALWQVTTAADSFTAVIRYADTNYVPCSCPSDTLRGRIDASGSFSGAAANGAAVVQEGGDVYEIVFSRRGGGAVTSAGVLTGEFRWLFSAEGALPPGKNVGEIYKSWTLQGTKNSP